MAPVMLETERVGLRLDGRYVLQDIGLRFNSCCLTVMVGPNGAGKSSLMRLLAGLSRPDDGAVRLAGMALDTLSATERARQIAYVPQDRSLVWPMPVRDLVMLGRLPHGATCERASVADWQAVDEALERTRISDLAQREVTRLSGGEKARVMLARALATRAPVLLVDEPIAALDPHHQWVIMELLKQEAASGAIVVAVLHDLALAARFADHLVMLDHGQVVGAGGPTDILTPQKLADIFGINARIGHDNNGLHCVQTGLVS